MRWLSRNIQDQITRGVSVRAAAIHIEFPSPGGSLESPRRRNEALVSSEPDLSGWGC